MNSKPITAIGKNIPTHNQTRTHGVLLVICSFSSGICLFVFLSFSLMVSGLCCSIPVAVFEESVVDLLFEKNSQCN